MATPTFIWFDDRMLRWGDATVHVAAHTLHYGLGILEGTRVYSQGSGGAAVFRLTDHLQRLEDSARILQVDLPFTLATLTGATIDLIVKNQFSDCYVRHVVFLGAGGLEPNPRNNPVHVAILCWPLDYLKHYQQGISCKIASITHHHPNSFMTKAKVTARYVNAILALREADAFGAQEALLLDGTGCITEATGHNVFLVRSGSLKTPPLSGALEGITRSTVMQLARFSAIDIYEASITRDEVYIADEVFLTGTAGEVVPVTEIDRQRIGQGIVGPVTQKISELYQETVRGKLPSFEHWLAKIPQRSEP